MPVSRDLPSLIALSLTIRKKILAGDSVSAITMASFVENEVRSANRSTLALKIFVQDQRQYSGTIALADSAMGLQRFRIDDVGRAAL